MIAEEDIKAGAIVLHLGNPDTWEDPEAIKDSHFVISDIHSSSRPRQTVSVSRPVRHKSIDTMETS